MKEPGRWPSSQRDTPKTFPNILMQSTNVTDETMKHFYYWKYIRIWKKKKKHINKPNKDFIIIIVEIWYKSISRVYLHKAKNFIPKHWLSVLPNIYFLILLKIRGHSETKSTNF